MAYAEDDFLMLSGIQHFQFCKRQWGLIHIQQEWVDNEATAHGQVLHQKADNPYIKEKRKDLLVSRAMQVASKELGLYGILDVVEFRKDEAGVSLTGKRGKWLPLIVEYKRGQPKKDDRDIVQLVAQTMCLEETLGCVLQEGCLYYHKVNKRVTVPVTEDLRQKVRDLADQMHQAYTAKELAPAEYFKNCRLCSLVDICLPRLSKKGRSVANYLRSAWTDEVE